MLQIRIWGLATRTDSDVCKLALNSCERFRHAADSTSTPTTVIATAAAALATTISMVLPMIVMIVAEIINKLALDNTKKRRSSSSKSASRPLLLSCSRQLTFTVVVSALIAVPILSSAHRPHDASLMSVFILALYVAFLHGLHHHHLTHQQQH